MPAKKRSLLPLIEIWNPCPVSWDEMIGNDEVRHCGQCSKHVYNLSGLRRSEAEALVAASHGRMCARFIRTADGDVQTVPELPPQVHGNARRASPAAAAIVTAVLGLGGSGAALVKPAVAQVSSRQSSESQPKPATDTAAGGAMASLSGKVTRRNGNPIPGAKVALTSVGAGATLRTTPGPDGLYRFQSVPEGSYELTTGADGLITTTFQGLELAAGRNVQLDVMMETRPSAPSGVVSISPTPLHSLYTRASVIIVGAPASSSTVENGQYSSSIKTRVNVLQVLKGQPKRDSIDVYHDEMRDGQDPFAGDALLLLFLEHRENKGLLTRSSYEPVDTLSAVKKLSQSALASYVDHLKSLQNILREEAPSRTELTEWAVQLAEDPVTREEAGNELDQGGYDPIFQYSDAEPPEKAPASAPSPTSTMSGAAPGPGTVAAGAPLTVALAPVSDERQVCAFVTASDLLTPSQK
ncbi:MAG TPA: carboxypeptidase-like regulatory domain-containing protein, partial [Blastocatellia bacterium]|nr:carboxypeptidase-like regulatory domain-containing protein [Blastocatellia bacterium]